MNKQKIEDLPILKQTRTHRNKSIAKKNTLRFLICFMAASVMNTALVGKSSLKKEARATPAHQVLNWGMREIATALGVLLALRLTNPNKKRNKDLEKWAAQSDLSNEQPSNIYAPLTKKDMATLAAYLNTTAISDKEDKLILFQGIAQLSKTHPSFAKLVRSLAFPTQVYPELRADAPQEVAAQARLQEDHCEIDIPINQKTANRFAHELRHVVQFDKGLMPGIYPPNEIGTFATVLTEAEACAYSMITSCGDTLTKQVQNHIAAQHPNADHTLTKGLAEDKLAGLFMQLLLGANNDKSIEKTVSFCMENQIDPALIQPFYNSITNIKKVWQQNYQFENIYNFPPVSQDILEQYNAYYRHQTGYDLDVKEAYNTQKPQPHRSKTMPPKQTEFVRS